MLYSLGNSPIHQIHSLYIKYIPFYDIAFLACFFFTLHVIVKSKTPMTMTTLLFYLFFVNLWIAINSEYTSFVMYMMNSATNCVSLAPRLNVSSHLYIGLQTDKPGSVIMQDTSVIRCCMPHMDWGTGIPQWHPHASYCSPLFTQP